jgi:hypothetical protein
MGSHILTGTCQSQLGRVFTGNTLSQIWTCVDSIALVRIYPSGKGRLVEVRRANCGGKLKSRGTEEFFQYLCYRYREDDDGSKAPDDGTMAELSNVGGE